ncbi:MAG: WecB/TagA/CpsF family glycosyltransferase [Lachnospiraceae bacterium]|nr:WecB/TagA/CpsF family glycosyltransferase [Lachnospiraceae bacterium]
MKTIELMGMEMNDLTVRECLHMAGEALKSGGLGVIYFLSRDVLLASGDSEEIRQCIKDADITLPDTKDILHAAGLNNKSREREIDRNLFLKGFLRILSREKKKIYIVADSREKADTLKAGLNTIQRDLDYTGEYILEGPEDAENAVNEINGVVPDVILSIIKSPEHEEFINAQRMKINARLLMAMTPAMLKVKEDGTIDNKGLLDRLRAGFFNKVAQKYKK